MTAEQLQIAEEALSQTVRQGTMKVDDGTPQFAPTIKPTTLVLEGAPQRQNRDSKWYLNREGELSVVTNEASNEALGILELRVSNATENQQASGILCKVSMNSLVGWDYGISIFESRNEPGAIYLRTDGSREIGTDSRGKKEYYRPRQLNNATEAQILSFVSKFLKPRQQ
jgi:hypothetical protein